MSKFKNEEGYVLIIVILFVVLIMGLSSVFMASAVTHTKQEEAVDQQHLTVTAAEMGVEYYTGKIQNEFIKYKSQLIKENNDDILEELFNHMNLFTSESSLKAEMPLTGQNSSSDGFSFKLEQEPAVSYSEVDDILVTGVVQGIYNNEHIERLDFVLTFPIPNEFKLVSENPEEDLEDGEVDEDSNEIISAEKIDLSYITSPDCEAYMEQSDLIKMEECVTSSIEKNNLKIQYSNVFVNEGNKVPNGLDVLESSIDINGGLDVNGSGLFMNKSKIRVRGGLKVPNTLKLENRSSLYVENNANQLNGIDLNNSTLKINGNANGQNDLKLDNNSSLYIAGNTNNFNKIDLSFSRAHLAGNVEILNGLELNDSILVVDKKLDINQGNGGNINNSLVCITGNFTFPNNINVKNSEIYVTGKIHNSSTHGINSVKNLPKKCSISIGESDETEIPEQPNLSDLEWKETIIDVSY